MPIKAKCKCGKVISAKSKYAGQRVKCPGCGQVLKLPFVKAAKSAPAKPAVANPVADLLDEIGFEKVTKDTCPECKVNLQPGAVLCVQCGFHLEKRRRLSVKRI